MVVGCSYGGDTGESTTGNGSQGEYDGGRFGAGGRESFWGCGWWMMIGTLLGPERTTVPAPEGGGASGRESGDGLLFRYQV